MSPASEAAPGRRPGSSPRAAEKRRRRRLGRRLVSLFLGLLMAALGTIAGLVLFDRVIMPEVVRHGDSVQIPPVTGMEVERALSVLRAAGLEPVEAAGRYHTGMARGLVLEISPPTGLVVKRGRQVSIIPSLGPVERRVPDLTGASLRMARFRLDEAGLTVRIVAYAATEEVPPDQVLAVAPQPGAPVRADASVDLLVSRRRVPLAYALPDLRGRDGDKAARWLEANGFRAAIITGGIGGQPGTVITQTPAPGSPLWPGDRVEIEVAPELPFFRRWG